MNANGSQRNLIQGNIFDNALESKMAMKKNFQKLNYNLFSANALKIRRKGGRGPVDETEVDN